MKKLLLILAVIFALIPTAQSQTKEEAALLSRLSGILTSKSANEISDVFPTASSLVKSNIIIAQELKILMLRGDVDIQLIDDEIIPALKAKGGFNGQPYKLVRCRPKKEIAGFTDTSSFVVGEVDGRLVILGEK